MSLKKEFLILLLIILFIIFVDIIVNNHFKEEKKNINSIISELQDEVLKEEDANGKLEELEKSWKDFNKKAAYYKEHQELEKVGLKIELVKKTIKIDKKDMTVEYLEEIKYWLDELYEKDKLNLKNIF